MDIKPVPPALDERRATSPVLIGLGWGFGAGALIGVLVFLFQNPWQTDYIHPLAFSVYALFLGGYTGIAMVIGSLLGLFIGFLVWLTGRKIEHGPGQRRPLTKPHEVRNALLIIAATALSGWLISSLSSPKTDPRDKSDRAPQPSEASPQPDGDNQALAVPDLSQTSQKDDVSCPGGFRLLQPSRFEIIDIKSQHRWHVLPSSGSNGLSWQEAQEECELLDGSLPTPRELLEILRQSEQVTNLDPCAFPGVKPQAEIWTASAGQQAGTKRALRVWDGQFQDADARLLKTALCIKRSS